MCRTICHLGTDWLHLTWSVHVPCSPTLAPLSAIVFLSPTSTMRSLPSSYSVANADAAVIVRASAADGTSLTGAAISWSSPNETINDATSSITSAYLKLPVGTLQGGGVYVLQLSATGFTSSQVRESQNKLSYTGGDSSLAAQVPIEVCLHHDAFCCVH